MSSTSILLSGIEFKIRKLIQENVELKQKLTKINEDNERLLHQNRELIEKNELLTGRINTKIIADSFSTKQEIEEGRDRIQALMREIEQCIALINK